MRDRRLQYIDAPAGYIPNLQIDVCWCANATQGIPVIDVVKLSFHSKSLPTTRLIWHCPYIVLFTSDDGISRPDGKADGLRDKLC